MTRTYVPPSLEIHYDDDCHYDWMMSAAAVGYKNFLQHNCLDADFVAVGCDLNCDRCCCGHHCYCWWWRLQQLAFVVPHALREISVKPLVKRLNLFS